MSAYAIIENGIVTNVVNWDGVPFTPANEETGAPAFGWPPAGTIAVPVQDDDNPYIGGTYKAGVFGPPPAPASTEGEG